MNASAIIFPAGRSRPLLGNPYLQFQLAQGLYAALPTTNVQEVLNVPGQKLTALPHLPACILGLTHRNGRVIWVVDLAQILGVPQFDVFQRQYELVLMQVDGITLALSVQQVDGIAWLIETQIQPMPNSTSPKLQTYSQGYVLYEQKPLWVLNAAAIAQSPLLHEHEPT